MYEMNNGVGLSTIAFKFFSFQTLHVALVVRDGLIEPGLFMGMKWQRVII